jgi:general secretion pathway protein K
MLAQKGTVLIIALLVVAIITGLAIDFSSRFQLSVSRGENRLFTNQIQQSLFSLESASMWALREDKEDDIENNQKNYDHLDEDWAAAEQYAALIQAEFGAVQINELSIEDVQGRFNLNQLGVRAEKFKSSEPFETRYTAQEKRFIRLLQTVPNNVVGSSEAEAVTQAVMDWIDSDNNVTGVGGAESDYYSSLDEPYRAANQPFVSVTELRLIQGITEEIYEHIEPLVIALPDQSGININTAPAEIMRTLNSNTEVTPISEEDSKTLESSRATAPIENNNGENVQVASNEEKKEGFSEIKDFLDSNEVGQVFSTDAKLHPEVAGLTTGSNFFLLKAEVEIDEVSRRIYSLLERDTDSKTNKTRVRVIRRGSEEVL